jgi:hypothetical protein
MVIIVDNVIVKSNEAANAMWDLDIDGLLIFDLLDASEHEIAAKRINEYLFAWRGSRKKNTYLTNEKLSHSFYVSLRSKPIIWEGKKALLCIGQKIEMPIQLPLKFSDDYSF